MIAGQNWLPDTHLTGTALAEPFRVLLRAWCGHWFAQAQWSVAGAWALTPAGGADGKGALHLDNGLSILLCDKAKISIAAVMLGLPLDKALPRNADARLVDAIADKALTDLGERLTQLVRVSEERPLNQSSVACRYLYLAIHDGKSNPILYIRAGQGALVAFAKSLARLERVCPTPSNPSDALAELSLSIGAKIGTVHLPLSDLETLGVGDVIAFQRPIDSELAMTVDGTVVAPDAVKLRSENHILYLEMTRSVSHDKS